MPGPILKVKDKENDCDLDIGSQSSATKEIKNQISGTSRDINGDGPSWDKSYQSHS